MTNFEGEIRWDDNSILFTFETPLTHEQRQRLAQLIADTLGVRFEDSFQSYSVVVDTRTDKQYLQGIERFIFINSQT